MSPKGKQHWGQGGSILNKIIRVWLVLVPESLHAKFSKSNRCPCSRPWRRGRGDRGAFPGQQQQVGSPRHDTAGVETRRRVGDRAGASLQRSGKTPRGTTGAMRHEFRAGENEQMHFPSSEASSTMLSNMVTSSLCGYLSFFVLFN